MVSKPLRHMAQYDIELLKFIGVSADGNLYGCLCYCEILLKEPGYDRRV